MHDVPTSPIVFVTSFRPDMYQATGIHLVASFKNYCVDAKMFVCTEAFEGELLDKMDLRIAEHDISDDAMLTKWLRDNADIIPRHLGGNAKPCDCAVTGFGIEEAHYDGCPNSWYNRNASRWFRKLVALKAAAEQYPAAKIIWLDSDCRFRRGVSSAIVESWFRQLNGFYFQGPQRKALESGIFGIDLSSMGRIFLNEVIARYTSGIFRHDLRWDDAYQIQTVITQRSDISMNDLATAQMYRRAEVIEPSVVGKYLIHYRGVHGPVLQIMI